jgi:hypothetical protein
LALALVILGFEARVEQQTQDLLELEQSIEHLIRQREVLQEQRKLDADYLAASLRQLYPEVSVTFSEDGRVEIPAGVLQELQQAQQQFLPAPIDLLTREEVPDEQTTVEQASVSLETQETVPPTVVAGESHEERDIDADAKKVLAYLFSQSQAEVLDWKTTIQHALDLPEPPKIKGHKGYKVVQQAYPLIEGLHDGTLLHPSDALLAFYRQYFIEGGRWADFKDTMNEWGIA